MELKRTDRPWMPKKKNRAFTKDPILLKFYNSAAWRKLSLMHRKRHPVCEICKATASKVTDHIQPISKGGKMLDWDNLQALCVKCHNKKSANER